jgi:hypothetical protein
MNTAERERLNRLLATPSGLSETALVRQVQDIVALEAEVGNRRD